MKRFPSASGIFLTLLALAPGAAAEDGASVAVATDPPGASITLDGRPAGITPATLRLPQGRDVASIGLTLDGYEPLAVDVRPGGQQASLRFPLEALVGRIVVDSDADGEPASDGRVTLREALAYARGDLAPRGADARGVRGPVGRGHPDRIEFHPELFRSERFVLIERPLPPLDDSGDSLLGPPVAPTIMPAAGHELRGAGLTLGPGTEASRVAIDGFEVGVAASGFGEARLGHVRVFAAQVGVLADDGCTLATSEVSVDARFAPRLAGGVAAVTGEIRTEPPRPPGRATVRRIGTAARPLLVVEGDGNLETRGTRAYARHAKTRPLWQVQGLSATSSTYEAYRPFASREEAFQKFPQFAVDGKADEFFQWDFRAAPEHEWLRLDSPRPLRTRRLRVVHAPLPDQRLLSYVLRFQDHRGHTLLEKEISTAGDADDLDVDPAMDFHTIVLLVRGAKGRGPGIREIEGEVLDCDEVPALASSRRRAVFPGGDPLTSGREGAFRLGGPLCVAGPEAFRDGGEFDAPTAAGADADETLTRIRVTRDDDVSADDDGLTLREALAFVAGTRALGPRETASVEGRVGRRFVIEVDRDVRLSAPLPEIEDRQVELRGRGVRLFAAEAGQPVLAFRGCRRLAVSGLVTNGTLRTVSCDDVQLRDVEFTACGDAGAVVGGSLLLVARCRFTAGRKGLDVSHAEVHLVDSTFDGLATGASLPSSAAHAVLGNAFPRTAVPFELTGRTDREPWLLLFGNVAAAGAEVRVAEGSPLPQLLADGNVPPRLGLPGGAEARGRGLPGRALLDLSGGAGNAAVAHVDLGLAWGSARIVRADGRTLSPPSSCVTLLYAEPLVLWFRAGDVVTKHVLASPGTGSALATLARLGSPTDVGRNTPSLCTPLESVATTRALGQGRSLPVFASAATDSGVDREVHRLEAAGRRDLALRAALAAYDRWPGPTSADRVAAVAAEWCRELEAAGRAPAADALYVRLASRLRNASPLAEPHALLLERTARKQMDAKAWPAAGASMARALTLLPDDPRLRRNLVYAYQQWGLERIGKEPHAAVAAWLRGEAARLPSAAAELLALEAPLAAAATAEALRKGDPAAAFELAAAQHDAAPTDRTRNALRYAFQEHLKGLFAAGKHAEALEAYRSAAKRYPQETGFANLAANLVQTAVEPLIGAGRGDAAVALASDLHAAAGTTDTRNVLGNTIFAASERVWKDDAPAPALRLWADAVARLAQDPALRSQASAYANRKAVPISESKRYALAAPIFRWGLRLHPDDAALRSNAAITYGNWAIAESNAKNHAKALAVAEEGLVLFPGDPRLQQTRDRAKKALGPR